MKILYDYQSFLNQNYGGISRYFTEIIKYLIKDEEYIGVFPKILSSNYYLKEIDLKETFFLPKINFKGKRYILKNVNKFFSQKKIKSNNFDIFHPTYYDNYFLKYLRKPFVLTVFDLISEHFLNISKAEKKLLDSKKELIKKATHIISISQSTKRDLIQYYNVDPNKVTAIYLGNSFKKTNKFEQYKKKIDGEYFLFVGNRQGYKNFCNLIKSISGLLIQNKINLICVGGEKPNNEEITLIRKNKVLNFVHFLENKNDFELYGLYKNALGFIFPSKYEGFGLPILESFSCGCPVLLSDTSSLPEIAGEAATYFNPYSIDSMKSCFENFLHQKSTRQDLILRGYERLKLFDWEKTFQETKSVYDLIK